MKIQRSDQFTRISNDDIFEEVRVGAHPVLC